MWLVGVVSRRWVWLVGESMGMVTMYRYVIVGVVVTRYIDILIIASGASFLVCSIARAVYIPYSG